LTTTQDSREADILVLNCWWCLNNIVDRPICSSAGLARYVRLASEKDEGYTPAMPDR